MIKGSQVYEAVLHVRVGLLQAICEYWEELNSGDLGELVYFNVQNKLHRRGSSRDGRARFPICSSQHPNGVACPPDGRDLLLILGCSRSRD